MTNVLSQNIYSNVTYIFVFIVKGITVFGIYATVSLILC